MQYRYYHTLSCSAYRVFLCLLLFVGNNLQARLMAGWDFSQIPANGDLSGFNGKISANYSDDFNFHTSSLIGTAARPFGTLYFDGSHGSGIGNRIYRGANLNANRGYPRRHTSHFGGGDGYSTTFYPFDDYTAQLNAGQTHAGPGSLAITQNTVLTFGINETLYGYSEENVYSPFSWLSTTYSTFSFGGRSSGGRIKISLQISYNGTFSDEHLWENQLDGYEISDNRDAIGDAEYFEAGEEKELCIGNLLSELYDLEFLTGEPDNPLYSSLYLRMTIELDMDTVFLLDNVKVVDQAGTLPEPADFALCTGGFALLGIFICRFRKRNRYQRMAIMDRLGNRKKALS